MLVSPFVDSFLADAAGPVHSRRCDFEGRGESSRSGAEGFPHSDGLATHESPLDRLMEALASLIRVRLVLRANSSAGEVSRFGPLGFSAPLEAYRRLPT
jgi:hypothetical protein